jgi:hypothetical protein
MPHMIDYDYPGWRFKVLGLIQKYAKKLGDKNEDKTNYLHFYSYFSSSFSF